MDPGPASADQLLFFKSGEFVSELGAGSRCVHEVRHRPRLGTTNGGMDHGQLRRFRRVVSKRLLPSHDRQRVRCRRRLHQVYYCSLLFRIPFPSISSSGMGRVSVKVGSEAIPTQKANDKYKNNSNFQSMIVMASTT